MSGRFNIIKEFIVKPIKNVVTGGSKTSPTISSVQTNVPTTKLEKKSRDLKLLIQKNKASKAKLNNTLFNIDQASNSAKTRNKASKKMFETAEGKRDGGRISRKLGGGADMAKRKTNVQKIKETFAPKKSGNVPSKFKGFSKLPEAIQQKMNKKLAKKV